MYNSKLTPIKPRLPTIMPIMPLLVLRPIMPKDSEKINMIRKNQREFHHVASGAEKQTRSQAKPAIANTTPAVPHVLFHFGSAKLFTIRAAFHTDIYLPFNDVLSPAL